MTVLQQAREAIIPIINPEKAQVIEQTKNSLLEQKKIIVADFIDKNPSLIPSVFWFKLFEKEKLVNLLTSDGFWDKISLSLANITTSKHNLLALHKKISEAETQDALESLKEEFGLVPESNTTQASSSSSGVSSSTGSDTASSSVVVATAPSAPSLKITVDTSKGLEEFYNQIEWKEKPDFSPFYLAMLGYEKMKDKLGNQRYLTVVDYSKSNKTNRLFVIDLQAKKVAYALPVGHGKKSWGEFASSFSDQLGSNQSSLGFYRTPAEITKANTKKWSGLLLRGTEESNESATQRGIYMHPGTVTGSEGCFTLPKKAQEVMEKLKWDSLLFAYYPDQQYLASSNYFSEDISRMAA